MGKANWAFACKTETLGSLYSHALLILTYTKSKNQVVHEQKFKDPLSSTCQISPERRVLHLESEVLFPLGVTFFSKSYNPNLHSIARSDRIGFKTKTPNNCAKGRHDCFFVFGQQREALFELFDLAIFQQKKI